jgi:staphylococcal nuclease domain-containing protein 1
MGLIPFIITSKISVFSCDPRIKLSLSQPTNLSNLSYCPQGRRDGSTKDEPFAWQSREFLRKMAAGKPCVFRVDYTLDAAGGREFGTVFVNEKDNIALASVAAGWARVRPSGAQQSPYYDDLAKAQEAAEAKSLGSHTKNPDAIDESIRESANEFGAPGFLHRVGKGKPVDAIVEAAISGSTLRVTLLPGLESATVMVAGVQCPGMGRRPAAPANGGGASDTATAAASKSGPAAGTAAAAVAAGAGAAASTAGDGQPEPFAREARHFTELRCLNRDVKLILEGVSQFGVLVCSVHYPSAPGAADAAADLGSDLIKAGLGKAVEWSLNMMTSGAFKLRESERAARQAKTGLWHSYVPQATNSSKLSDKFTGTVIEVVSGDCLIVKDASNNVERRVMVSSIKAPRGATRDRAAEPWATEAKEFLRQRLIGKEVSVSMEYTRKVPAAIGATAGPASEERVLSFGTVKISEKSGAETKENNVAELLLVRGLAQVIKHRGDEERSAHFEDLINAEDAGKKGKKGQWSSKEPAAPRINDVTGSGSAARARQYLPFLQRAGKLPGVVEYVLGGSRLKIHVPKEGVTLAFSPSGVRCPAREEPYAPEAVAFTRSHCLQRDVEIEVNSVDKAGTFLGTLRVPPSSGHGKSLNLGVALLENGLAKLHHSFEGDHELDAAQAKAQKHRAGLWEKEDPEAASRAAAAAAATNDAEIGSGAAASSKREVVEIVVTDVTDANTFYIQLSSEARAAWVADQLANMSLDSASAPSSILKTGDKCLAKFAADGLWYRAQVEKVHAQDPTSPQYDMLFLDYGNKDRVGASAVRPSPPDLAAVPPQAHLATLAYVRAPELDVDYGVEAAQTLSEMVGSGKKLRAIIEARERPSGAPVSTKGWGTNAASSAPAVGGYKLLLTILLGDEATPEDYNDSVNCQLVSQGLARVLEPRRGRPAPTGEAGAVYEAVRAAQDDARANHAGIFEYGDPGSDDEDDGGFPAMNGKR